jgi:hypothetical protein
MKGFMKKLLMAVVFFASAAFGGDLKIKEWSVDYTESTLSFQKYRLKVAVENVGADFKSFYIILEGEDKDGYPIIKEMACMDASVKPHSISKNVEEIIIKKADADAVKTWAISIKTY